MLDVKITEEDTPGGFVLLRLYTSAIIALAVADLLNDSRYCIVHFINIHICSYQIRMLLFMLASAVCSSPLILHLVLYRNHK